MMHGQHTGGLLNNHMGHYGAKGTGSSQDRNTILADSWLVAESATVASKSRPNTPMHGVPAYAMVYLPYNLVLGWVESVLRW